VPVVDVVDVVAVGDGDVAATLTVSVVVIRVPNMTLGGALVEVSFVGRVQMPVVDVVDVVAMGDGHVTAALTVDVRVVVVLLVGGGHGCSSFECRMAS